MPPDSAANATRAAHPTRATHVTGAGGRFYKTGGMSGTQVHLCREVLPRRHGWHIWQQKPPSGISQILDMYGKTIMFQDNKPEVRLIVKNVQFVAVSGITSIFSPYGVDLHQC